MGARSRGKAGDVKPHTTKYEETVRLRRRTLQKEGGAARLGEGRSTALLLRIRIRGERIPFLMEKT